MRLRSVTLFVCLVVVALCVVPHAGAQIKFSGVTYIEPSFEQVSDGKTVKLSVGGSRVRLTAEAKFVNKEADATIAMKVQPFFRLDGTVGVDDAFVQLSKKTVSFKIGRFKTEYLVEEGPLSSNADNDAVMVVTTADGGYKVPAPYRGDNAWGRKALAFAFDIKPNSKVLLQLGGIYVGTTESENKTTTALVPTATQNPDGTTTISAVSQTTTTAQATNINQYGLRPVVKVTLGNFVAKAGFDYVIHQPQDADAQGKRTKTGFGGEVIAKFGKCSASLGAASYKLSGESYVTGKDIAEKTVTTIGGRFDVMLGSDSLGFYVAHTSEDVKDSEETYGFALYTHKLPFDGAYVKLTSGYATGTDESGKDVNAYGGRVRFEYNF